MFPIPFNFPFIKKNGERTTIGDAINSGGGGGGGYTLPTASADTKGGVKIGAGLTMTGEVLSNNNPTPYNLPTASAETLGGIKVGSGLLITDGVLSAAGGSGGGHLFTLQTNADDMKELAVFTSESTITNLSTLLTALQNGVGVIIKGKDNANYMCPTVTCLSNNSLVFTKCILSVSNSDVSTAWASTTMGSGGISVSNIKQIY